MSRSVARGYCRSCDESRRLVAAPVIETGSHVWTLLVSLVCGFPPIGGITPMRHCGAPFGHRRPMSELPSLAHGKTAMPQGRRRPVEFRCRGKRSSRRSAHCPTRARCGCGKVAAALLPRQAQDAKDLLQEAFARALDGSRKCPRHVDVVRFLAGGDAHISSDGARNGSVTELQAVSLFAADGVLAWGLTRPTAAANGRAAALASDGGK